MSSDHSEQFQQEYSAGKDAFERGHYSKSVQHLEKARDLIAPQSRLGGELGIWLVTAYQAANQSVEAIALCEQLSHHPYSEIRKQGKNLLYILQAPALKRPEEWMVQIPDLGALPDSDPKDRRGSRSVKPKSQPSLESVDLTQVNTKDNQFIWIALLATILTLSGLWWLS